MKVEIKRPTALVELNGEVVILSLSWDAWEKVIAIASEEGNGSLVVARVKNQSVLDELSMPTAIH